MKKNEELKVFKKFIEITKTKVDMASIVQPEPPGPDIGCVVNGEHLGFELTSITDQGIEETFGRKSSFHYQNYKIKIEDVVKRIEKKASLHNNQIMPMNLILHESNVELGDLWLCDQKQLNAAVRNALKSTIFMNIWILDISNERSMRFKKSE